MTVPQPIEKNVWMQHFPMSSFGMQLGRNVTLLRLASGKQIIHSTAAFRPEDVAEIRKLGDPAWLVEATNFHDTFAQAGTEAFPELPYLVPEGFKVPQGTEAQPLQAPDEWQQEIELIRLEGMPRVNEHALFHRPSGTLVVADLVFNIPKTADARTLMLQRWISGIHEYPGNSRLFQFLIKDAEAFERSLQRILALDIKKVIVSHGDPMTRNPKDSLVSLFRHQGFEV